MRFIALSFLLFLSPGLVSAQTTAVSRHWLSPGLSDDISSSAVTKAGGPVVSFPCDPLMSVKQERLLSVALMKPSTFHWVPGQPLNQMAAELSEQVPVILDTRCKHDRRAVQTRRESTDDTAAASAPARINLYA